MNSVNCELSILTDIDQLIVAYEKAKKYLDNLSDGIQQQIEVWIQRRDIINNDRRQHSFDFLASKTDRITELAIKTVETLCRADLFLEQIRRVDPQSLQNRNIPTRPSTQPSCHSSSSPTCNPGPINFERSNAPDTLPSVQEMSRFRVNSPANSITNASRIRPNSSLSNFTNDERAKSPAAPIYSTQRPQLFLEKQKVRVPLQKVQRESVWQRAKIEVIDSIFAFYVKNMDEENRYRLMFDELNAFYRQQQNNRNLSVITSPKLGDFGVACFSGDKSWRRARFLTITENRRWKIVFIDYGDIEDKQPNEFFYLDRKFCELPAQVVAGSLSKAFPRTVTEESICPEDLNEAFRDLVHNKTIRAQFQFDQNIAALWPLPFVDLTVDNQTVTRLLGQYLVAQMPNSSIAERLSSMITETEYILFNVNTEN